MLSFKHVAFVAAAALVSLGAAWPPSQQLKNARAVYFMTNDPAGNSVVALKAAADGSVSQCSTTSTGGKGLSGLDIEHGLRESAPDALFSQSAIDVKGNTMTVVNPGSNTLTLMAIDSADPCKLSLIGQPVDTMGEFPVTAAISPRDNIACVGNGGAKAGIVCFSIHQKKGLKPIMTRAIDFPLNQTTPAVGPFNTVSQVFFSEDGSSLITTVKGDPAVNNVGFLSVLPIYRGRPGPYDSRSSPAGTAILFGSAIIPGTNKIIATDVTIGAATIAVAGGVGTTVAIADIANQDRTCWVVISPYTKTGFLTDLTRNSIVEVDPLTEDVKQITYLPNDAPGMIDLTAAGKLLYVLSPGNGTTKPAVVVVDVSERPAKQVQLFEPEGVPKSAQGMAMIL